MLCYDMLCHVVMLLCYVMLCYVMLLCYVMICYVMLLCCYVMLCYVMSCCYVVMLCYVMICYVMLLCCYVMLCYVMSCCYVVMLCIYFLPSDTLENCHDRSKQLELRKQIYTCQAFKLLINFELAKYGLIEPHDIADHQPYNFNDPNSIPEL